jgi:RNA polymerase sigma factor (sigma-70 family)
LATVFITKQAKRWGPEMSTGVLAEVLRYVRTLTSTEGGDQSDSELLEQFVQRRNESAFAALLERHGPLVLSVCHQVLRDEQEAADAFQAVFLVLAQKAGSVRRGESLAAWLHRVALNVSRTVRTGTARRRAHEREALRMARASSVKDEQCDDWKEVLNEEVDRLPQKYRLAVILCYFEGKTHAEAARALGWPLGTVKGRLARARDLLRARLTRRAVALSATGLAASLAPGASVAVVPPALLALTLRAAVSSVAGTGASASALAEGAFQTMTATKLLLRVLVLMLAVGAIAYSLVAGISPEEQRGSVPDPLPKQAQIKTEATDPHGDPLPPGAIARLGTLRFRHGQHIQASAFSPDGKAVASAGSDGRVVLHDAATGKKLRSFRVQPAGHGLTFAPDGKILAAGVGERLVGVWEVATGKRLRQFEEGPVHFLAFSHDGRTLAGAEGSRVQVWDVQTGKAIRRITHPQTTLLALAVAPDGKSLVTAGFNSMKGTTLFLWDTASGRELRRWQADEGEVNSLAFSPDGKRLASASIEGIKGDDHLRVWAIPAGQKQFELPGQFHSPHFSPSGKILAAAANGLVFLWAADTGKEIRRIPGGGRWTPRGDRVCFSPDGRALAVSDEWTIALWDVASGKQLSPSLDGHEQVVESVRFLPDGKSVAATSRGAVSFWHVPTGNRISRFETWSSGEALSPDGKVLAVRRPGSGCTTFELWDTATGKELRKLEAPLHTGLTAWIFSPDGKMLAAAFGDGIRFWDVVTGKLIRQLALRGGYAASLAFAPDGKTLAVTDGELGLVDHLKPGKVPTARLLDAVTGQELRKPFELSEAASSRDRSPRWVSVGPVAFSGDGKVLAAAVSSTSRLGTDPTIQVWEAATGRVRCRLERELAGAGELSRRFVLSPDGKSLVTVGENPRLWEVATGKVRASIRGHSDAVWAVDFSPDGRLLASGSQDTTVLVWDALNPGGEPPAAAELSAKELQALWADLAGEDAARAYRAIRRLVAAPAQAVPFLQQHLRPGAAPDPKRLAHLIADLDAKLFTTREEATRQLERLGRLASPALEQALAGRLSPEARRRAEGILNKLERFVLSPEELRGWRAIEALEHIGTSQARKVLEALSQGASAADVTVEVKAALQRLVKRPTRSP